MDTALLNSKMNEYMFRLNQKVGAWLSKKLPKITDNWLQDLVINNLSSLQKDNVIREEIKSIDRFSRHSAETGCLFLTANKKLLT